MRLVFVHGRDQQGKDLGGLKRVWTEALDCGLAAAGLPAINEHEVVFPYYADDLASMVAEICGSASPAVTVKGNEASEAELDRIQIELLQELFEDVDLSEDAQAETVQKGLQNTRLVRALARRADNSCFGPGLLACMTADVSIYLQYQAVARRINDFIATAIGTEPCVVVAHSLGSIVAYRVLREVGTAVQVRSLITLGSPLGLQAVRKLLSPPVLSFPAGVNSWMNAFDPADIVALHPLDKTTWPITPTITNHSTVENHMSNHHGISGYLDDPIVARAIYKGLNGG